MANVIKVGLACVNGKVRAGLVPALLYQTIRCEDLTQSGENLMNGSDGESKIPDWEQIRHQWGWRIGVLILMLFTFMALFAPLITPYDYAAQNIEYGLVRPLTGYDILPQRVEECHLAGTPVEWLCTLYLFGSDSLGRDLYSRFVYGARLYLLLALIALVVSLTLGAGYGVLMAYFQVQTRLAWRLLAVPLQIIIEVLGAFPGFILAFILLAYLTPAIRFMQNDQIAQISSPLVRNFVVWNNQYAAIPFVCLIIALTCWLHTARTVRRYLVLMWHKQPDQKPTWRNLMACWRPQLSDLLKVVLMTEMLVVPTYFLTEMALSFAGMGVLSPFPSWAAIFYDSIGTVQALPAITALFGAALSLLFLAFYAIGFSMRDQMKLAEWP